ncbi:RNA polymerase factor sigma-54 [Thermomonas fusca]|uniref:RNA polymerase factor sigma-54 n=1 Tax=Thermomonas fusca TaxID=215690 RepID=UPI00048AA7AA|nr:RNA polymerase factor sigma-54 [Thermomonas fusca]
MKASLQAKMGQSMTLTPQLLQSIRLLQVTSLQLEQELHQILERNPLLEQEADEEEPVSAGDGHDAALEAAAWDELPEPMFLSGGSHAGDPDNDATARIAAGESSDPRQRLLQQLQLRCNARELAMAAWWLDCCDDRGYLEGDPFDLARHGAMQLADELPDTDATALLAARQRLLLEGDWPGMAAADPRECLLAQLRTLPASDARALARRIVGEQLETLARHELPALARQLDASPAEVATAVALVLSLQPHPVEQPPEPEPAFIVPDVIAWRGGGGWQVRLNTRSAPRLRLCAHAEQASGHAGMRGLLDEARWLLRSLGIRNETLLKTSRVLVTRQQAFLEQGEEAIAPLTLKDVAEEIGVHESTISRITTGKYIQTPRGTLELKRLFAVRLEGAEVSGAAIKAMVRRLIEDEPAHAPLADEVIAAMLARQGIRVARRTVAKYREQLCIAPARMRRRERGPAPMARLG